MGPAVERLILGLPGETVGSSEVGPAEGLPRLTVGPALAGFILGLPGATVGPTEVGLAEALPGLAAANG